MAKYKRLLTFGCSHTYGHGLPDCIEDNNLPGSKPSNFAWPAILSKKLNLELINYSEPGSSNKRIWDTILKTEIDSDDLVLILWTQLSRSCIITGYKQYVDIGTWKDTEESKAYLKYFYAKQNRISEFNLYMSHISMYLDSKNITNYHMFSAVEFIGESTKEYIESYNNGKVLSVKLYENDEDDKFMDYALDGVHAGLESHKTFAEKIEKELKKTRFEKYI